MKKLIAITLGIILSGCSVTATQLQYSRSDPNRGNVVQPADLREAGNDAMIRIIKEDRILEMWKRGDRGWQKVKVYDICKYSGDLGPKKRTGDKQAPEGFYSVTIGSLNPRSSEHLSFNLGFPNERDRAAGYTGSYLMVHGGCESAGCYAITDQSMEEVYSAVRDALKNGQRSVQVQIYPFKMTDYRMWREKKNPNYKFWTELKAGWDRFEKDPKPLQVGVKDGKYVIR